MGHNVCLTSLTLSTGNDIPQPTQMVLKKQPADCFSVQFTESIAARTRLNCVIDCDKTRCRRLFMAHLKTAWNNVL